MSPPLKRPRPARGTAWGILNPYGDLWTCDVFPTPDAAMAHVEAFWRRAKGADASGYKAIPVRVTVSALRPTPKHTGADDGE